MYFGDVVFAISGALTAARYRMDVLGFVLIGTITGIGGGVFETAGRFVELEGHGDATGVDNNAIHARQEVTPNQSPRTTGHIRRFVAGWETNMRIRRRRT
jgi:hypothetical protein